MKQCPVCKTTYPDVTLRFCLADGNTLDDLGGEQTVVSQSGSPSDEETLVIPRGGAHMRVEIPRETVQTVSPSNFQPTAAGPGGSSGGLLKILLVILGLGIFAVLAIAAGTFIYLNRSAPEIASNVSNKDAKTQPLPAANETDELRDQIANLEKRLLNDQKKNNQPANVPLTLPKMPTTTTSAHVNSPGDGFLALRSLPNSEAGERILKIPHGATIAVGACGQVVRPVSRTGRWCQASYNGYSGWVFDAYLIY